MRKIIVISFLASSLLFAADEEASQKVRLGKSVVSAKFQSENVVEALQDVQAEMPTRSVSVITKEKILTNTNGGGVHGILESVPGILYVRSGANSGQISMRGMNSNNGRSIIAIDGVRVVGRTVLELNMIDPNSLDSIEIIRGAASSLYGSNAINGVINFKTRRYRGDINAPFSLSAKVRALEFNSVNLGYGGRVELLGGGNGWDILVGTHGRKADDFRTPLGIAKDSNYETWGVDFNIGYTKNSVRYYTQGKYQKTNAYSASGESAALVQPGSSFGGVFATLPLSEYYLRIGAEAWDLGFADKMDLYAYWRQYDTDLTLNRSGFGNHVHLYLGSGSPSTTNIYRKVYDSNQAGGNIGFYKVLGNHALNYGVQVLSIISPTPVRNINLDTGASSTAARDYVNTELAAYLKDDWQVTERFLLSGSLRYDYIMLNIGGEKFTNETPAMTAFLDSNKNINKGALTGSIGGLYNVHENVSLTANISQNFKSPGTSGIFANAPELTNLDLKPEYAQTYEVGARFHNANHVASLVGFWTEYENMIQSVAGRSENVGKAQIKGIEFESHHIWERFLLDIVGAYTYGQDKSKNIPLAYIAPLYGNISLGYKMNWGTIKWTQRAYLGKTRIDPTQERESESYTMSDIALSAHLGYLSGNMKDMWLTLGVNNIFNTKGRNPVSLESLLWPVALTNPLLEPGINGFVKFAYQY